MTANMFAVAFGLMGMVGALIALYRVHEYGQATLRRDIQIRLDVDDLIRWMHDNLGATKESVESLARVANAVGQQVQLKQKDLN